MDKNIFFEICTQASYRMQMHFLGSHRSSSCIRLKHAVGGFSSSRFPCRFASQFTLSHIWPPHARACSPRPLGGLLSIRRLLFFSSPQYPPVSHLSSLEALPDFFFLKHDRGILRQSSNPVCGFSMMEQVRLCAVWPT